MSSLNNRPRLRLALGLGLAVLMVGGASAQARQTEQPVRRNVILMIADGQGFNGWLATDYFTHGRAGAEPYMQARSMRPDSRPANWLRSAPCGGWATIR